MSRLRLQAGEARDGESKPLSAALLAACSLISSSCCHLASFVSMALVFHECIHPSYSCKCTVLLLLLAFFHYFA
jgi:hypothetical protein